MAATLEDWFERLERELPAETVAEIRAGSQADLVRYHRGLGAWIRNQWRAGAPVPAEVRGRHLDDMSSLLLVAFWCHLRGLPIELDEQRARYEDAWRRMTPPRPPVPPGCDAEVELRVVQLVTGSDGVERHVHAGRCKSDGSVWVWELDRGWFRPEPALLASLLPGL